MKFDRDQINGKLSHLVFDIEDIHSRRGPVCSYGNGDLAEAIDHADNRGGMVVSADWKGFIDCVHVSSKVRMADLIEEIDHHRTDDESRRIGRAAIVHIRNRLRIAA